VNRRSSLVIKEKISQAGKQKDKSEPREQPGDIPKPGPAFEHTGH